MNPSYRPLLAVAVLALPLAALAAGCATLQQVAALRQVDFELDRVDQVYLAGVRIDDKRSYEDLSAGEVARLVAALAAEDMPLRAIAHVTATNPEHNNVSARLVRMDWTLFIEEQETVSGRWDRELVLEPGRPTDVPVAIDLDLYDFFSGRARDLFDLALAVAGVGGPSNLRLEATPTIETPIGPIRYPAPVTIVDKEVGGS